MSSAGTGVNGSTNRKAIPAHRAKEPMEPCNSFPPLQELLPHRGRAILLNCVVSHSTEATTCKAILGEDFPYLQKGNVPAVVALELMAQTAGVHAALIATTRPAPGETVGGPAEAGYLLAAPELDLFEEHFALNDELTITVRPVFIALPLAKYAGEVDVCGAARARGQFSVFLGAPNKRGAGA